MQTLGLAPSSGRRYESGAWGRILLLPKPHQSINLEWPPSQGLSCANLIPSSSGRGVLKARAVCLSGKCPVVLGSHPSREWGANHMCGLPLGSGYSSPSQQPSLPSV